MKKSSVQAKDVPKKNYLDILEKDNVSSCGSAGTKLSSPGSLGLTNEADSRDLKTISSKDTMSTEVQHASV